MSTVLDNPILLRTGYLEQLKQTPDVVLRRKLLDNDWTAGFNQDADLQVIPGAWVDAAMARWTPSPGAGLDVVGVDVARGGKDRSAIVLRHDTWFGLPIVRPGSATPDGPTLAALVLEQMRPGAIAAVDATGVGGAVVDALRARTSRVVPIVFGARYDALDRTRSFGFVNIRSGLWWRMRELSTRATRGRSRYRPIGCSAPN